MRAIELLVEHAAEIWGVTPGVVMGETRATRDTVNARFAVMYVGVKRLNLSTVRVGRAMRRDHTTVMYGVRRAEDLALTEAPFRAGLDQLSAFARDIPPTAFAAEITSPSMSRRYLRRISDIAIEQLVSLAQENPDAFRNLLVLAMRGEIERDVERLMGGVNGKRS